MEQTQVCRFCHKPLRFDAHEKARYCGPRCHRSAVREATRKRRGIPIPPPQEERVVPLLSPETALSIAEKFFIDDMRPPGVKEQTWEAAILGALARIGVGEFRALARAYPDIVRTLRLPAGVE